MTSKRNRGIIFKEINMIKWNIKKLQKTQSLSASFNDIFIGVLKTAISHYSISYFPLHIYNIEEQAG